MQSNEIPRQNPQEVDPNIRVHEEIVEEWEKAKETYKKGGKAVFANLKKKLKPESHDGTSETQTDIFEEAA